MSNRMSPSKIRRNKARAEAHAAKKNLDKDSTSSTSHVSDNSKEKENSESGNPVQNIQVQNDEYNKEIEPALGLSFLGDSLLAD